MEHFHANPATYSVFIAYMTYIYIGYVKFKIPMSYNINIKDTVSLIKIS